MDSVRIAELLRPFLAATEKVESTLLTGLQLKHISTYLDLLLRWNARLNLTAVRDPEYIVTRHFGESLFAARYLFPKGVDSRGAGLHLIDFGSGAGFPGLAIKIWIPAIRLTLIESHQKKSTFLREVIRHLGFTGADVFGGRGEDYGSDRADVVTLRAVERFENAVTVAAHLVAPTGRLALLIGKAQCPHIYDRWSLYAWHDPVPVPLSASRVLLVGRNQ